MKFLSSYKCQKAAIHYNLISLFLKVRLKPSKMLFEVCLPLQGRNHTAHFRNISWSTGCPSFPGGSVVKNLPTKAGNDRDWVQCLDREGLLEEEMATHCSILAWRIPWTEEPGRLQPIGSQSRTRLSDCVITHRVSPLCSLPNTAAFHALERLAGLTSRVIRKQLTILGHYMKAVFSTWRT